MTKFIRIRFPDGDWDIPAEIVAKDRATYYAKTDPDTTYDEEFTFAMDDEYELTDWASNNMDWADVKAHAVHVKPLAIDYENEWVNAEKTVVERDDSPK